MENIYISFLITSISGFATMLGLLPTYINKSKQSMVIGISMALSIVVILYTSLFVLIPEGVMGLATLNSYIKIIIVILSIDIGFLLINYFDKALDNYTNNHSLLKIGFISSIAVIIHNIPEGIITFLATSHNLEIGMSLAFSILLHNIPEGISIAVLIYYSTNSRKCSFYYTFIAGFSELIGGGIAYFVLGFFITPLLLSILTLITAGIMLYLSLFELLPNCFKYSKKYMFTGFIIGIFIVILIIIIK